MTDSARDVRTGMPIPAVSSARGATQTAGTPDHPNSGSERDRDDFRAADPAEVLAGLIEAGLHAPEADCVQCENARRTAERILAAGWRPPLPKTDARLLRSLVAGIIDGHFGDDYREQAEAAAQEIIDRGWLDKTGAVGQPEPVATTLRRIIRDLEEQTAGPQRHTHAGIALSQYADRLRGHPALDGDADAGWPLLDAEQRAASWWEAAKYCYRAARTWSMLAETATNTSNQQRTRADAAEAKLDQIREVLAEDWGYSELGITDFMHDQVRRLAAIVFASPEEWQSTVDHARAERETDGINP